jgi:nitrogenase molybdenum-cofactor synthesis protein NifE
MMKVNREWSEKAYDDRYMHGVHDAFALGATAIKDVFMIFHGVPGCRVAKEHIRTDNIPEGQFVGILTTAPLESNIIHGGTHLIERTWKYAAETYFKRKKPKAVFFFTSCGTSINQDDVGIQAEKFEQETGIKAIYVDTPNFLGREATGLDILYRVLLDEVAKEGVEKVPRSINIAGTHLIGSKNFKWDIKEIKRLIELLGVKVNCMLTLDTPLESIENFWAADTTYMLSGEEMPEFLSACEEKGMEIFGRDWILPYGMANTEEWYLKFAEKFDALDKAKEVLKKEMNEFRRRTLGDYNFTWIMSDPSSKRAAVIAYAPFAAAMAKYLYYDLNVKVVAIGLLSETPEAVNYAIKNVEDMSEYFDFEVFDNPTNFVFAEVCRDRKADFVIGRRFDRTLFEGQGMVNIPLGGRYFMNQFNFVPWPWTGVTGVLGLQSEVAKQQHKGA